MTRKHINKDDLVELFQAFLQASDIEQEYDAFHKFQDALEAFGNSKSSFRAIGLQRAEAALNKGLIGYCVYAAWPEDFLPTINGKQIQRKHLVNFNAGQKDEMVIYLDKWMDEHYKGIWEKSDFRISTTCYLPTYSED